MIFQIKMIYNSNLQNQIIIDFLSYFCIVKARLESFLVKS